MIAYLRRRFNRWCARTVLCHRMRFKSNTPDAVLRYMANTCGDAQDKLIATYLD